MNRKGNIFTGILLLLLLPFLLFVWAKILPGAVETGITTSIAAQSHATYGDMTEMILRIIPWGFPILMVLVFIYLAVTS